MPPTFLLAHLYAEAALDRVAHGALPHAAVRPARERGRRLAATLPSLRRRRSRSRASAPGGCVPAA